MFLNNIFILEKLHINVGALKLVSKEGCHDDNCVIYDFSRINHELQSIFSCVLQFEEKTGKLKENEEQQKEMSKYGDKYAGIVPANKNVKRMEMQMQMHEEIMQQVQSLYI